MIAREYNLIASLIELHKELFPARHYLLDHLQRNHLHCKFVHIVTHHDWLTQILLGLFQDPYEIDIIYLPFIEEAQLSHLIDRLLIEAKRNLAYRLLDILAILVDDFLDELDQLYLISSIIHQFFCELNDHVFLSNQVVMELHLLDIYLQDQLCLIGVFLIQLEEVMGEIGDVLRIVDIYLQLLLTLLVIMMVVRNIAILGSYHP